MKAFKKSVWVMLSIFFAILFAVTVIGSGIMNDNQAGINGMLGITTSEIIDLGDDENEDKEYYKPPSQRQTAPTTTKPCAPIPKKSRCRQQSKAACFYGTKTKLCR